MPLILLADPEHQAIAAYDVWRERHRDGVTSKGIERATFLIDEEGVLTVEKRKVQVDGQVEEMFAQVR